MWFLWKIWPRGSRLITNNRGPRTEPCGKCKCNLVRDVTVAWQSIRGYQFSKFLFFPPKWKTCSLCLNESVNKNRGFSSLSELVLHCVASTVWVLQVCFSALSDGPWANLLQSLFWEQQGFSVHMSDTHWRVCVSEVWSSRDDFSQLSLLRLFVVFQLACVFAIWLYSYHTVVWGRLFCLLSWTKTVTSAWTHSTHITTLRASRGCLQ